MSNKDTKGDLGANKKNFIELPANFFLTEIGEKAFYKRHIPLREIRNHYNKKGYGFYWANYDAKMLQRLVINRFLKEIVITRFEYSSKRTEINDITKLIIYGVFYEEINKEICSIFVNSEFIEALNSKNPLKRIDMNSNFDKQKLTDFINTNSAAIAEFKNIIAIDPFAVIDNDQDLDERAKNVRKLVIKEIIENIELKNWFLFYFILKTEDKVVILQELNNLFMEYLRKIKIADFMSLMILELLGNIEKGNYLSVYLKSKENVRKDFNKYVLNDENKKVILKSVENRNLSIILNYNFSFHIKTGRYILTITIINKTNPFEEKARQDAIPLFKNKSGDNLLNYLNAIPEEELSNTISLYYLKSLFEECKEIQANFEAKVVFDGNRDETISYLIIHL